MDQRADAMAGAADEPRASILNGVGRAISHIFKSGGGFDRLVICVTYFWQTVVSCCIRHPSDDYSKQRLFEASVTVHSSVFVEFLTTALGYLNHTGPKSKIMPPRSAQTMWSVLYRVRCGGWSPIHSGGLDGPWRTHVLQAPGWWT